jgi:starch phosphorylase
VFTIHPPVSAGNERFDADLVRRLAGPLLDDGGVPVDRVLELGLGTDADQGQFDMTAFSLRLTSGANAVSKLHAHTANSTWNAVVDREILGVTNGVHGPTWVGAPVVDLLKRDIGADLEALDAGSRQDHFWERIERIPAADLWDAHLRQKRELAIFVRGRLRAQFARHGEAPTVLHEVETALDPGIMTIGFARRFATYKRAALLFSDLDRLARLLWDDERPMQVIFAGKAHPADRPGQQVIQEIFQRSRSPELRGRVFILEDYDIRVGRYLVQGVDVWLNNPRRPLEASGTSGMKAAQNGVPNMSVLDGWWDEGYTGDNGWAVGTREADPDEAAQDWADAQDIYRLLEEELVPAWYDRDDHGIPVRWVETMRRAMGTALWRFSTTRMLQEYTEQLYLPASGTDPAPTAERERVEVVETIIAEAG